MQRVMMLSMLCLAFGLTACGQEADGDKATDKAAETAGDKAEKAAADAPAKAAEKADEKAAAKPAEKPAAPAANTVDIAAFGLKVEAPAGTNVSEMLGDQMLQGPGLVMTVGAAGDGDPKDMAAAVKDMKDTYDGVANVKEEALSDGWIFTAENKGGMGTNYWVKGRRTINGKAYTCETTANSAEQQAAAVKACKSMK